MEERFDPSAGRTLGMEEELMLVDAEALECVPRVAEALAAAEGTALRPLVKTELFASVLELTTPVCGDVEELGAGLVAARAELGRLVAPLGLRLMAAGTHPISPPEV